MFSVAGFSTFKDGTKVRFANELTRVKILAKNGHSNIELIELPEPMDKPDVVKYLLTTDLAQNPIYSAALDEANAKYNPEPKTVVVKTVASKKVATAKVVEPEEVESQVAES